LRCVVAVFIVPMWLISLVCCMTLAFVLACDQLLNYLLTGSIQEVVPVGPGFIPLNLISDHTVWQSNFDRQFEDGATLETAALNGGHEDNDNTMLTMAEI